MTDRDGHLSRPSQNIKKGHANVVSLERKVDHTVHRPLSPRGRLVTEEDLVEDWMSHAGRLVTHTIGFLAPATQSQALNEFFAHFYGSLAFHFPCVM